MIRFQTLEWEIDDSGLTQTITTICFSKVPSVLWAVSSDPGLLNAYAAFQVAFTGYRRRWKNVTEIIVPVQ